MNPNHFLAVAIQYLYGARTGWSAQAAVGKTLVSSSMIDRVAADLGRRLVEVPVGFKWFVPGLLDGSVGFGGEESAGASFLRRDGSVWTTDKDGILLALLASEILAVTGREPERALPRISLPHMVIRRTPGSTHRRRARRRPGSAKLSPEAVTATELAGEPITARLTAAPGNGAAIGGLKVTTESAWFAARPSGTEDVYKIYAESFRGPEHLAQVQAEAREVVSRRAGLTSGRARRVRRCLGPASTPAPSPRHTTSWASSSSPSSPSGSSEPCGLPVATAPPRRGGASGSRSPSCWASRTTRASTSPLQPRLTDASACTPVSNSS